MYWANKPHFGGIISRYLTCNDHDPLPHTWSFNCPNWLGGGTEREVKGENCQGGGGRLGGGKVKGQLSLRLVGTLVIRQRMKKTPAVQSGRALPMGRCASPPCIESVLFWVVHSLALCVHLPQPKWSALK